jgi:hypothetical protein
MPSPLHTRRTRGAEIHGSRCWAPDEHVDSLASVAIYILTPRREGGVVRARAGVKAAQWPRGGEINNILQYRIGNKWSAGAHAQRQRGCNAPSPEEGTVAQEVQRLRVKPPAEDVVLVLAYCVALGRALRRGHCGRGDGVGNNGDEGEVGGGGRGVATGGASAGAPADEFHGVASGVAGVDGEDQTIRSVIRAQDGVSVGAVLIARGHSGGGACNNGGHRGGISRGEDGGVTVSANAALVGAPGVKVGLASTSFFEGPDVGTQVANAGVGHSAQGHIAGQHGGTAGRTAGGRDKRGRRCRGRLGERWRGRLDGGRGRIQRSCRGGSRI